MDDLAHGEAGLLELEVDAAQMRHVADQQERLTDGRLRSRRWRPVAAAAIAVGVLVPVGSALAPVELEDIGSPYPYALAGPAGMVPLNVVGATPPT